MNSVASSGILHWVDTMKQAILYSTVIALFSGVVASLAQSPAAESPTAQSSPLRSPSATNAPLPDPPVLNLPIDCKLGQDCFVQNYVDRDPSPNSRDFKCGSRTYNAHNGTDFRIQNHLARKKGVAVLAAAAGNVDRLRDGEPDISVRVAGPTSVANKECGNAVVINHGDGWSTQYCHMANGSIVVRPGQKVAAGDKIGAVGLSGNTEYPHLHISVRHNSTLIDPFSYGSSEPCGGGQSLWSEALKSSLQYHEIEALNQGFASLPVTMENIESGDIIAHPLTKDGPLIAYIRVIGLKAGDVQTLTIFAPDGNSFASQTSPPSDTDKAQVFLSIGRRNSKGDFQSGEYKAVYTVTRANAEVFQSTFRATR